MQTAKRERTTHDHNQQETRRGIIVGFSIRATCGDCDDPGHCRSHDQCHYTGTALDDLDANGQGISIVEINDETTEVHVNGTHVTTLTHDEDGWQGMRRVESVPVSIRGLMP